MIRTAREMGSAEVALYDHTGALLRQEAQPIAREARQRNLEVRAWIRGRQGPRFTVYDVYRAEGTKVYLVAAGVLDMKEAVAMTEGILKGRVVVGGLGGRHSGLLARLKTSRSGLLTPDTEITPPTEMQFRGAGGSSVEVRLSPGES
ncbi:MAG: hypothetical protein ACE366_16675 [Bradymonadia bacterium]